MELKRTPLYKKHIEYGGKMVPFAGFEMPLHYKKGIVHEVIRVRTTVGMFDVSHMGEIEVSGTDALEFVRWLTLNDPAELKEYEVQYSAMCYPDGGIVDDILVYRLPQKMLIVVNAANIEKDYEWIKSNKKGNVEIHNISDEIALLAVQGEKACRTLQKLVDIDLTKLARFEAVQCKLAGTPCMLSRTGYTGEDGFEVFTCPEHAEKFFDAIIDAGREFELEPVGLGARDTLRLEAKLMLYGNDIDDKHTPLEAGLGWLVKFNKPDFIGKKALLTQKEKGLTRKLAGFVMLDNAIPRQHYPIYKDGKKVGEVTSGNYSPMLKKPIGLGYIDLPWKVGDKIQINCRGQLREAEIIKGPFFKRV